jgi:hypothetical protein
MKLKCALVLAMQLFSVSVFAADTTPSAPPAPTSQSVAPSVSQSVFVVAPEDLPKQTTGVVIDTPKMPEPEKKKNPPLSLLHKSGLARCRCRVVCFFWSHQCPC